MKMLDLTFVILGVLFVLVSLLFMPVSLVINIVGMVGALLFGVGIGEGITHKGNDMSHTPKP